jgi:DnaJ-domain-containing protein 1
VDKFFDRLGDFVRSFMHEEPQARPQTRPAGDSIADPDMQDAWEELDAYLNDKERPRSERDEPERPANPETEVLRQDYANLEVPFGAPFEQVKKSYRRMMAAYHPDRNAQDPQRLRLATEITQKLNASYRRIETHEARRPR